MPETATESDDAVLVSVIEVHEMHNPEAVNKKDSLNENQKAIRESNAEDIEQDDCNGNNDSDVQADELNQRGLAESNIESSVPLLPETEKNFIQVDVEGDNNGSDTIRATTTLDQIERIFLVMNFMIELSTTVFDQLSSQHNPKYALISLLMSFTVLIISLIILVHKGIKESVKWMERGNNNINIPWFYYPSTHKPFGAFPDTIGVICGFFQCVSTGIAYGFLSRHANSPIKISAWPVIFASGLLCCGFRGKPWVESRVTEHGQFETVGIGPIDQFETVSIGPIDRRANRRKGAPAVEHLEMLRRLEEQDLPKNLGKFNLLEMLRANEEVSIEQLECLKTNIDEPLVHV